MNFARRSVAVSLLALVPVACSDDEVVAVRPEAPVATPAWFAHFATDERLAFVADVERWFRSQQLVPELQATGAMLVRGGKQGAEEFDLELLAELCAGAPRGEWLGLIDAQLRRVVAMRDALASVAVMSWQDAQDRLRLRIHPESFLEEGGLKPADVAGAVDLPGTVTLAFVDGEESATVVSRNSLERWRQATVGVLAIALVNTRRELEGKLRVDPQDIGPLGTLYAITSGSYYGASMVLDLDSHDEMLGEHGAIVAVPTRDAVFVWPFDDLRVKDLIPALYRLAGSAADRMGGELDRGLFWRRPDGRFERIEIAEAEGKLEITPPPDLARLIVELGKR
ncbi:MAG: hypothetical protein HZB39_12440 [Planctomycetes bacterium]|nr:hypothetical protein [Planctomycetota bacterium]